MLHHVFSVTAAVFQRFIVLSLQTITKPRESTKPFRQNSFTFATGENIGPGERKGKGEGGTFSAFARLADGVEEEEPREKRRGV